MTPGSSRWKIKEGSVETRVFRGSEDRQSDPVNTVHCEYQKFKSFDLLRSKSLPTTIYSYHQLSASSRTCHSKPHHPHQPPRSSLHPNQAPRHSRIHHPNCTNTWIRNPHGRRAWDPSPSPTSSNFTILSPTSDQRPYTQNSPCLANYLIS
jgi:hypothetical protein